MDQYSSKSKSNVIIIVIVVLLVLFILWHMMQKTKSAAINQAVGSTLSQFNMDTIKSKFEGIMDKIESFFGRQKFMPNMPLMASTVHGPSMGGSHTTGHGPSMDESHTTGHGPSTEEPIMTANTMAAVASMHEYQNDKFLSNANTVDGTEASKYHANRVMNNTNKFSLDKGSGNSCDADQLNINGLMPSSWSKSVGDYVSGSGGVTGDTWSKYAPTKEGFDKYITASGSSRLGLNTRNPMGRTLGVPLLIRSPPPLPLSTKAQDFNDSTFRQTLVFDATGNYPQPTHC